MASVATRKSTSPDWNNATWALRVRGLRAPMTTAEQISQFVDFGGREGDDRAARRQACDLFFAGIGKLGEARTGDEIGAGNEVGDRVAHCTGAQHQRFQLATGIQQPIGEDVSAIGVRRQLDLVDGKEIYVDVARHGFDGADPIASVVRLDLFFAGDQRNIGHARLGHHAIINLACQQAQRQADETGVVAEHALDRQMRLASVSRAEHRGDIADAG